MDSRWTGGGGVAADRYTGAAGGGGAAAAGGGGAGAAAAGFSTLACPPAGILGPSEQNPRRPARRKDTSVCICMISQCIIN